MTSMFFSNSDDTCYTLRVRLLILRMASYKGPKDLAWFIQKGNAAEVFRLLDSGVSVDSCDEEGRSPLMWAADQGHHTLVTALLDRGAKLNLQVCRAQSCCGCCV